MRSDRSWLLDILEAIHDIERYRPATRAAFDDDERTQVWMLNRLQIIGEASRALSEDFRWSAITERVPELERQLRAVLESDPSIQEES